MRLLSGPSGTSPKALAVAAIMVLAATSNAAHVCHVANNVRFDVTSDGSATTLRRYDATTNALLSTTPHGSVPAPNPAGTFWGHGCAYAADMQVANVWVYPQGSQTSAAYWDILSATEDQWRFQTSIGGNPTEIVFTTAACGGAQPPAPSTPTPATPPPSTPKPATPVPATPTSPPAQSTPQPPSPPSPTTAPGGRRVCHVASNVRFEASIESSATTLRRYDATTNALLSTTPHSPVPMPNPAGTFWGDGCAYAADMQVANVWVYAQGSQTSAAYWDVLSATEDQWRFQTSIGGNPTEIVFTTAACGGAQPPAPSTPTPATPPPSTPKPATQPPATSAPQPPATPAPQPPATPAPGPNGYVLVFADEFDSGAQPDASKWNYELGYVRNGENQRYTNDAANVFISDGTAKFRALRNAGTGEITSGSIFAKTNFKYGKFEARLKSASGVGAWPAFWLVGADYQQLGYPSMGEMDVFEYVGWDPQNHICVIHSEDNNWMTKMMGTGDEIIARKQINDITTAFHTYTLEWTPDQQTISVDGQVVLSNSRNGRCRNAEWPFLKPFEVKLNLAIGGAFGGAQGVDPNIFPTTLEVDYVRIYQMQTPPADPVCDIRRWYLSLSTGLSCNNLNAISTGLLTNPTRTDNVRKEFMKNLGDMLGVAASPSFDIDRIRPICPADGNVRLLFDFTSLNVNVAQLTAAFAGSGMNAALQTTLNMLESHVSAGTWAYDAASASCPHGNTCDTPLRFERYALPATIPFVNYDYGGEGVSYHDDSVFNENYNGAHRSGMDRVDIRSDLKINFPKTGEWMLFSELATPASCSTTFRVSVKTTNGSPWAGRLLASFFSGSGSCAPVSTTIDVAPTANWDTTSDTAVNVNLGCGCTYGVKWEYPIPNYNLVSFSVTPL